jgi:hypothetical protein
VGARCYQEQAPGVAVGETVRTPAGTFTNCVKVRETNPLEKGRAEYKWYAPGIGVVKEGEFVLVRCVAPK